MNRLAFLRLVCMEAMEEALEDEEKLLQEVAE